MSLVFDTNILIDLLHGHGEAEALIESTEDRFISIMTWIETMVGARGSDELGIRALLRAFEVVQVEPEVAELAAGFRRERRLKLPDAIILATAVHLGCQLVTRNTKDFPADDPLVLVPYQLPGA